MYSRFYSMNDKTPSEIMQIIMEEFTKFNRSADVPFRLVDENDFDIIPKKSKIEKDLAAAEERKRNAEKSKEMSVAAYDRQILAIDEEIKELKKRLK